MNELTAIVNKINQLETEIERLKRIETPHGTSLKSVAIKDDGAIDFTPQNTIGFLFFKHASHYAIISFDASPMPLCIKVSASALIDVATVALSGTTGTDGRITISASNGKLYIENRTGATITGRYLTL